MIRTEYEYKEAIRRIKQNREAMEKQETGLLSSGLRNDQVNAAMEPLLCFHEQLNEEVRWYDNVRRHNFTAVSRLTDVGLLLIAARIAGGINQRELANRLNVSEASVSRDEKNEYHGITLERAQKIFDALHCTVTTKIEYSADYEAERSDDAQLILK